MNGRKKTWTAPKLSIHGDMAHITLTLTSVKRHGTGDSLATDQVTSWQSVDII